MEQALTCGRFRADICAAYQTAAATGTLTPEIAAVLDRSSPAGVLDRIDAPTLLIQGTQDSLFGLGQADANARGIAANGTAVKVVWFAGGHDSATLGPGRRPDLRDQVAGWFDFHLRGRGRRTRAPASSSPRRPGWAAPGSAVQGGSQTVVADRLPRPGRGRPAERAASRSAARPSRS